MWFFLPKRLKLLLKTFDKNGVDLLFEANTQWDIEDGDPLRYDYEGAAQRREEAQLKEDELQFSADHDHLENKVAPDADWDVDTNTETVLEQQKNIPQVEIDKFDDASDAHKPFDLLSQEESEEAALDPEYSSSSDYAEPLIGDIHAGQHTDQKSDAEHLVDHAERDIEAKQLVEEQHSAVAEDFEAQADDQENLSDYKPHNLPLASYELIDQLREAHNTFYSLLSMIQETHAPNDFVAAYHIQDRIAHLLNNKTLLYQKLAKELLDYLNKINNKLDRYHREIMVKQQDLKLMNSQIERFKEYSRKTQQDVSELVEEKTFLAEDIENFKQQKQH